MNAIKRFRSCFVIDVAIDKDYIVLTDSSRERYYINRSDDQLASEFKNWFKTTFQKGIAQTLTVFAYEVKDINECEQELHIVKFLTLKNED